MCGLTGKRYRHCLHDRSRRSVGEQW